MKKHLQFSLLLAVIWSVVAIKVNTLVLAQQFPEEMLVAIKPVVSGGGGSSSPFSTNGLVIWLEADGITNNLSMVQHWPDLSGYNNFGSNSPNTEAYYVQDKFGMKDAVQMDNGAYFHFRKSFTNATFIVIARSTGVEGTLRTLQSTENNNEISLSRNDGYSAYMFNAVISSVRPSTNVGHVAALQLTNGVSYWVDGTNLTENAASGTWGSLVVGANGWASESSREWIGGLLVFSPPITNHTDFTNVLWYCKTNWGTP